MNDHVAILNFDVYESSFIDYYHNEELVNTVFKKFYEYVDNVMKKQNGEQFSVEGDSKVYIFNSVDDAIIAAMDLLKTIEYFNKTENTLKMPIYVRLAIHVSKNTKLKDIPVNDRKTYRDPDLDFAGHIQKQGIPHRILISQQAYDLTIYKQLFRPGIYIKHMGKEELTYIAKFGGELKPLLTDWEVIKPDDDVNIGNIFNKKIANNLLVIYGETNRGSRTLQPAALSDAVGITDLFMSLNKVKDGIATVDEWESTEDEIFNRNLLIVGSGIVNRYAYIFNDIVKTVHFARAQDGDITPPIVTFDGKRFGTHDDRHYALIAIFKNPFNLEYYALWFGGISGIATNAAARFLVDVNEKGLEEVLNNKTRNWNKYLDSEPIACVIKAEAPVGYDPSEYYKKWKIMEYSIVWMADHNGKTYQKI